MNWDCKDFIGIFPDVYPEGFCEHMVVEFDHNQQLGAGTDRQNGEGVDKHRKNDYQLFSDDNNIISAKFKDKYPRDIFFEGLQRCFEIYGNEFSVIKNIKLNCKNMKMQKTSSGGGYHVWHSEQGNGNQANRGLVYSLYLNTLPQEANGETEFLYQQRRINPVENTMVLWPAAFTHAHRGNPVYGDNTKYIITGWFCHE
jgi:hypothetical protein